jgi:hypothetical protein
MHAHDAHILGNNVQWVERWWKAAHVPGRRECPFLRFSATSSLGVVCAQTHEVQRWTHSHAFHTPSRYPNMIFISCVLRLNGKRTRDASSGEAAPCHGSSLRPGHHSEKPRFRHPPDDRVVTDPRNHHRMHACICINHDHGVGGCCIACMVHHRPRTALVEAQSG